LNESHCCQEILLERKEHGGILHIPKLEFPS